MRFSHFVVSVLLAAAVATTLLLIVAGVVVASGIPAALSTAMRSSADEPVRRAMAQAERVLIVFYAIVCPLIAATIGWIGGRREQGPSAAAASAIGVLPLAAVVLFTGSLRVWAMGAAALYVALGAATATVASRKRLAAGG